MKATVSFNCPYCGKLDEAYLKFKSTFHPWIIWECEQCSGKFAIKPSIAIDIDVRTIQYERECVENIKNSISNDTGEIVGIKT